MARTSDPARKPALLSEIIEFLLDKPLITLSFRTLALGLGVSTYTLVYHFGTREQLLRDIVTALTDRQDAVEPDFHGDLTDVDAHVEKFRAAWRLGLEPRSRQLLRLEFEAAMLEMRDDDDHADTRRVMNRWYWMACEGLVRMGIARSDAELESRIMIDLLYGLQYDLLVTNDDERATASFERALVNYGRRLRELLVEQGHSVPAK